MKFKVRQGFVCPVTVVTKGEDGQPDVSVTNTFPGGTSVDFDEATAVLHLHKLEPKDKAAEAFCEERFAKAVEAPAPAAFDMEALGAAIAAGILAGQAQAAKASAKAAGQ